MIKKLYSNHRIPFFLICLLGIAIPLPLHLERIVVVLISLYGAVLISGKEVGIRSLKFLPALLPPLFIALHVAGMLYTSDLSRGWQNIETKLALVIVPLFASLIKGNGITLKDTDKVLLYFVLACLASYLYILLRATFLIIFFASADTTLSFAFSRDNLAGYLTQHPIYIALMAACCVQILFYLLMQYWQAVSTAKKIAALLALVISFGIIILMGARMSLIAVTVTLVLWLAIMVISHRKFFTGFVLLLGFASVIATAVLYIPNIKVRFKEVADTELAPPKGAYHNSTNLRVGQFYCSFEVIKQDYIAGTGTGDYQAALNKCYQQNNFSDVLYLLNYNPHNQYLQSFIALGILGLLLLLSAVLVPIRLSVANTDWLIFMLFSILAMSMLTESVLQTNLGVMIFSFIYGLFVIRTHLYNKQSIYKSGTKITEANI